MKNIGSELGGLLKKICLWGGVMAAACWAFTLLWGFAISQLTGFLLGWGYMCLCMFYLGVTCEKAVDLDGKKGTFCALCWGYAHKGSKSSWDTSAAVLSEDNSVCHTDKRKKG